MYILMYVKALVVIRYFKDPKIYINVEVTNEEKQLTQNVLNMFSIAGRYSFFKFFFLERSRFVAAGPKTERLTILRAVTHETELGDHDFCLSRSHYTDTDPTSRERAATAGIEPGTSSPGVLRSTD